MTLMEPPKLVARPEPLAVPPAAETAKSIEIAKSGFVTLRAAAGASQALSRSRS